MATGALDSNGIWQYGEDDSETTFAALLNKLGASTSTQFGLLKPSGRLIQQKQITQNTTFTLAAASGAQPYTGVAATITPKFATSSILITFTLGSVLNATNSLSSFTIRKDGAATTSLIDIGTQPYIGMSGAVSFVDPAGSTAARTYTVSAATSAGSITVNDGTLIVTEIGA